jgi:hypothetical protein
VYGAHQETAGGMVAKVPQIFQKETQEHEEIRAVRPLPGQIYISSKFICSPQYYNKNIFFVKVRFTGHR